MKSFLFISIIILVASSSYAQVKDNDITTNINTTTYQLFATQNIWTFIKLNTRNGQMWQIQFDIKDNNRGQTNLSLARLVTTENEKNGRFMLYPTQNIYTFMLIDQIDGRMWQVQWSMDSEKRLVVALH